MRFDVALTAVALTAIGACSGGVSTETNSSGTGGGSAVSSGNSGPSSGTTTGSGGTSTSASTSGSGGATSSSASSVGSTGAGGDGGTIDLLAELKAGPWLFGFSGGLDHYSWVRFNFANATQGSVDVLDAACASCTGYWPCQGQGLFSADTTNSVILQLPQGCNNAGHTLVFTNLTSPGGFPPSATLAAIVSDDTVNISGYEFPPGQCNAGFTTCGNPFQ